MAKQTVNIGTNQDDGTGDVLRDAFKKINENFDEIYTENFRFNESLSWMENCSKMVFMGTSFSVNITNIALEIAIEKNIPISIAVIETAIVIKNAVNSSSPQPFEPK